MELAKLFFCLLLISSGVSAGFLSNLKSKTIGSEATNKAATVDPNQPVSEDTEKDKDSKPAEKTSKSLDIDEASIAGIEKTIKENNLISQGDTVQDIDQSKGVNDIKSNIVLVGEGKEKKGKHRHKHSKKDYLPDDTTLHPVQVIASSESVAIPDNEEGTEDLHIVPQKNKKKPSSDSPNDDAHDAQDTQDTHTVAVITEEKLDAAVDNLKDKQSKSSYKDPALQNLIDRAKEVKSERAYLKKLVLGYSATQAFLSATDVIPFRDPIIFTIIKVVTYLKNALEKPLSERYAEHQRVYSSLVTELVKNNPKYSNLITKMPKKLIIKTKDGKDIVVDIIDEKEALREDKLKIEKMNFVSLFRTGMQMK